MDRDRYNHEEELAEMAMMDESDAAYDIAADFESLCDSIGEVAPLTPIQAAVLVYTRDRLAA